MGIPFSLPPSTGLDVYPPFPAENPPLENIRRGNIVSQSRFFFSCVIFSLFLCYFLRKALKRNLCVSLVPLRLRSTHPKFFQV